MFVQDKNKRRAAASFRSLELWSGSTFAAAILDPVVVGDARAHLTALPSRDAHKELCSIVTYLTFAYVAYYVKQM